MKQARTKPRNSVTHLLVFGALAFSILFMARVYVYMYGVILSGRSDFAALYSSSRLVIEGKGEQIYNEEAQYEMQAELFNRGPAGPLLFYYLSYSTLIWAPLAYLPYLAAVILWFLANAAIVALLSVWLPRYLPHTEAAFTVWTAAILFGFFPIAITLLQGQVSIIMLLLYSTAFILLKKERPFAAGATLALGLFKFQLVLPFVGLYLLFRRWRFVAGFLAGSVVPLALSVYISGWQSIRTLIELILRANENLTDTVNQAAYNLTPVFMPNLRGLIYRLFIDFVPEKIVILLVLAFSAGLVIWAARRRPASEDMAFALALSVTLLVSYHLYLHDVLLLVLPALILVNRAWADKHNADVKLLKLVVLTSPAYIFMFNLGIVSLIAPVMALLAYKARSYDMQKPQPQSVYL